MTGLFPYQEVRKGQIHFMNDVKNAITRGENLLANAPTGIGKTAAVLAPALEKAITLGYTVFFLTPKHTQHTIVLETLKKISEKHNIQPTAIDFIGKRWYCLQELGDLNSKEFNEYCASQKRDELCKYYNNARKTDISTKGKQAAKHLRENILHSEEIKKYCATKKICPFEICVEAAKKADVIIADYFHIFSGPVRNALLKKIDKNLENSIIIIDEAHNLPDRLRGLLTRNLSDFSLKQASKESGFLGYHQSQEDITQIAAALKKETKKLKTTTEKYMEKTRLIDIIENSTGMPIKNTIEIFNDIGQNILKLPKRYRSYTLNLAKYLQNWMDAEIGYARILWKKEQKYGIQLNCLDPSLASKPVFTQTHSNILMSGTLTPINMYIDQLGFPEEKTIGQGYPSPFPKENKITLLTPKLTTKYKNRTPQTIKKYGQTITKILKHIPGNAAAFFPSYNLLNQIASHIKTEKITLTEKQEMTKTEKKQLQKKITHPTQKTLLLGVQAGSLAEGVDYPDGMLDAVIIVGLPLEKPTLTSRALIDYYDFKFQRGWDYGYTYPAMNKVLQAAGRAIRSESDKAAIILMDERFSWINYRKCLPSDFEFTSTQTPEKHLDKFYNTKAKNPI